MGYSFTKANDIDVYLVDHAMLIAECKVIDQKTYGDHILFIGEASNIVSDSLSSWKICKSR